MNQPNIITKIKLTIVLNALKRGGAIIFTDNLMTCQLDRTEKTVAPLTGDMPAEILIPSLLSIIDEFFEKHQWGQMADYIEEFRSSGIETGLSRSNVYCRGYKDTQVAGQLYDGTWAGWTYYSGGGKHGDPSRVPWLEHAYQLDVVGEEKIITVKKIFQVRK